jgi:hypothetical protein
VIPGTSGDAAAIASNATFSGQDSVSGLFIVRTSDATSARPTTNLRLGAAHVDTTLKVTVFYDGANWRNPVTGAVA